MSDTTPRPDDPADDPTAPPPPEYPTAEGPAPVGEEPAADEAAPADETGPADEAAPPPPPPSEAPRAPEAAAGAAPPPPPQQAPGAYGAPQQPPVGAPPQQPPPGYAAPRAPMTPQDERTWSIATHGITLAALLLSGGTLGFVAALVLYLVYRDRGPYIRANTANALNIQIVTAIGALISFVLMFVLIGFFTIIVVGIYAVVLHIIGMVKANNGEWWDPPLTPKFVR